MLRVYVANQRESRDFEHPGGPLEFGRGPQRDTTSRCVVNDPFVSKDQLRATLVTAGQVKLENLSKRNPMRVGDSLLVSPGGTHDAGLPVRITIGKTLIELSDAKDDDDDWGALRTIEQPVHQTFGTSSTGASLQSLIDHGRSPSPEVLAQWFETVVSVQRAAASSAEFFEETANALVQLVGLDSGLVLMRRDDKWQIVAECHKDPDHEVGFSDRILQHVTKERRTFYQALGTDMLTKSLMEIEAVVASPVFAEDGGEVLGAVYGSRHHRMGGGGNVEIRPLEAQVVQVLAAAVGAGVARMEHVQESTRRAVLLEQAFTPEIKQALDLDPELFEGRDRDVTMLFGDIRAFSRVSEKLGAADTCRLVRDVMEALTKRIREFQGTLVDYMGDGLMAMWNAPADQPDHAELACRAALAMQEELPELNQRWHKITGEPMRLGIGLNTGNALVGDTGTTYKLKYSALGHTVNLASRVEGATKQLGVPILITGSTYESVKKKFSTRRLCCVRVVGIHGQVDLFELCSGAVHDSRGAEYAAYEMALSLYEAGKWDECCQTLYSLLSTMGSEPDRPCLNLLSRAVECLRDPPDSFDPVLELSMK